MTIRKLLLNSFLVSILTGAAQDEKRVWYHTISAGIHQCSNSRRSSGHESTGIIYRNPGRQIFYRLIKVNDRLDLNCFSLGIRQRKAHIYESGGGLAGGSETKGDVGLLCAEAGWSYLVSPGKNKNFAFGGGIFIAYLVSTTGVLTSTWWPSGNQIYFQPESELVIRQLGANLELRYRFRLTKFMAFTLGGSAGSEMPERSGFIYPTLVAGIYGGFEF